MGEARTSENIYQKMARIRKNVEVLKKDKAGFGYTYVSDELILANITGMMDKLHISLIPEIVPGTAHVQVERFKKPKYDKESRSWKEELASEVTVQHEMIWHWVNNDNPAERISVPWFSVGQQTDASQAFGSGLTYSSRYFKLVYFNVAATKDDPDHWRSQQKIAEQAEQREVAAMIITQVDATVNEHLRLYPDDRDTVKTIIMKYAREKGKPSANYNAIVDPVVAAQLKKEIDELVTARIVPTDTAG